MTRMEDRSEKYHYAILRDGKEEIVYWFKGLKYPYSRGYCHQVYQYLAPVPSYEEYISLVNWKEDLTKLCTAKERIIEKYENIDTWWKAKYTELKEENAQLKERNDSLNNRDINLCRIANGIRDENFALKELLKECREEISDEIDDCTDPRIELFAKINEVLK